MCYYSSRMENLKQRLIQAGYKLTAPRKIVLNGLFNSNKPISARALHKKIKKADQASVYRALNLFAELNLVNVEMVEKEKLYCLAAVPHHHIICKKCGYMEEIACRHNFGRFKNFNNIHHQLTLTGVCKNCI